MTFAFDLPEPPSWMGPDDDLHQIYERQDVVRREGRVVWGLIYMANMVLWEPGNREPAPAGMVYSFAPRMRSCPERLAGTAHALYAFHHDGESRDEDFQQGLPHWVAELTCGPNAPRPAESPWVRQIQDDLLTGMRRVFHARLPPELTGPVAVYHTSVMLFPEHLPGGYLQTHVLPILVGPRGIPLVLPHSQWPER